MKRFAVLATAIAIGLAFTATAKTYTTVFSQSFDDATSYTENFYDGSVASDILGTTDSDPGTAITGTAAQKQRYGAAEGEMFYFNDKTAKSSSNRALYKFPTSVSALTDYKLEFDYYLSPTTGSDGRHSSLVIRGVNGTIATFDKATAGSSNGASQGCNLIYGEENCCTNTFSSGGRGADPSQENWASYWLHVTIYGNVTDGLFMSVVQDNGNTILANTRVGDFQAIDRLFFYVGYAKNNEYEKRFALDNVICYEGAAQTFVWTGAEGDSKWSTPGNWTVGGEVQTEKYPEIGDFVSGVDATMLAALDIAVQLEEDGDVARFVNLSGKSEKTWVAQGADTRWTTLGNWVYTQGGFAVYEAPARGDTLTFPASLSDDTEVSFSGNVDQDNDASGYALVVEGKIRFVSTSNAQRTLYSVKSISGSGVLSLGNVIIRTMLYQTLPVSCSISADGSSGFYLRGGGAKLNLSCALIGSGSLKLDADANGSHAYTVTGDLSGFVGTLEIPRVIRNDSVGCSYNFNGDDSTIDLSGATVSIADPMTLTLGGTYTGNILKIGALTGAGTINNNTANAMTLQVGNNETGAESAVVLSAKEGTDGWTVSKVGANTQSLTDETVAYNVSVSAGTLALPVGKALGTVAVSGGTLGFAADSEWVENTPYTLFTYSTWDNPSSAALALDQSAFDIVHSVSYDFETAGTVSLTLSEAVFDWNGGASGRWVDASNWLLDGGAAVSAPTYQNKVTIDGATVSVDVSAELSAVTLSNGAKIAVMFTDDTLTYTIPSGMAATDFVAAGPYTAEANDGVLTATRVASTFTWAGGASGEWTDAANWTVGGGYTGVLPNNDDIASFVSSAEVTVSSVALAGIVSIADALTVSGTGSLSTTNITATGDGILRVAGITVTSPTTKGIHTYIDSPLEIVAGTTNIFTVGKQSEGYKYIYFNGNISGSGVLRLDQQSTSGLASGRFSGDNSDFAGEIAVINQTTRDVSDFTGANSTSSNAVYTVYGRNDKKGNVFTSANTTYCLGALNGNVYQQSANGYNPVGVTLEIGNLNEDCSFGGDLGANKTAIRKIGTAVLTCSADNIGDVEIAGGTYEVTANTQKGNIKFTGDGVFRSTPEASSKSEIDYAAKFVGSTDFPIVFDDGDTNRTWSSAIPASNTAGFTKLGAGTLSLEKAPLYTGWTTVKAGKLVVPDGTVLDVIGGAGGTIQGAKIRNLKFAEGAMVTADAERYFITGTADVSNLTIYIADPAAAMSKVVVKAESVTGTPTLAFPDGTSEALRARWSLESNNGRIRVSSVKPFTLIFR